MAIDHKHLADLAAKLCTGTEEVDWRSSASRAYYSAFHHAHVCVDICPDNSHLAYRTHEALEARFMSHGSMASKSICYILKHLKRIRVIADYEIEDNFSKGVAESQHAKLKDLSAKIDEFQLKHRING